MVSLSLKRVSSAWIITILTLFLAAIIMGIIMRLNQGNDINLTPNGFYTTLTTHGLTMIGIWTVAGLVGIHYLMARYVKVSTSVNVFALVFTVVGVVMIWVSTFAGNFHAGWTFLYPLPFYIAWAKWATPLFLYGLAVLGITWFVWIVKMMMEILKRYSLKQAFAWQHFFKKDPEVSTPPFILIATVSLVGIILCLITAVILLVLLFAEYYSNGSFKNDPLLMKNLTYFFGHTIANEALYLGVALLYELLPEVSGRPRFKMTWYIALAWNCTMVFVLTAFFHHMYMDFVQPLGFQMVGQLASYFASIPAAAVSALSVIFLIYGNKIKWSLTNILFFIGVIGWMIGGIGAVIDATISNNIVLHNTLWVPAHFHTYNAMGNVLFCLAFFWWVANEFAGSQETTKKHVTTITLLLIGGFGFVLMFYLAGADSVPRRFSSYPKEFSAGASMATAAAVFASVYFIAVAIIFVEIFRKCIRVFYSS